MALLGGAFALPGAIIGSGIFIFLADFLNKFKTLSHSGAWLLVLGVVFILVVMFFRKGVYGEVEKILERIRQDSKG